MARVSCGAFQASAFSILPSYFPTYVTCQTLRLPSSVTKSEPSLATATPTGRPHT
jgi:hypothetical protein